MAIPRQRDAAPTPTPQAAPNGADQHDSQLELMQRTPNALIRPKSISLGRLLTRPLVAPAHRQRIVFEATGNMYEMTLRAAGRTDKDSPAIVCEGVDWTDPENPQEIILVCNEMLKSAFQRCAADIKGLWFAIAAGDIVADKRYRHIEVRQLEVER
jgi:hypothetical protein